MIPQQILTGPLPQMIPLQNQLGQTITQNNQEKYFAIALPGLPVITDFQQVNDMLVYDLQNPASVSQITLFLLQQIPEDFAGVLYYSTPPYTDLSFLGAIANSRPSDIFTTGFGLNPTINQFSIIKLVIKAEPISNNENLQLLVKLNENNDIQKEYAKKVAQNLYNFMVSFHKVSIFQLKDSNYFHLKEGIIGEQQGYLVIPENFLDRWYQKFEMKYKVDPNFIMKTQLN